MSRNWRWFLPGYVLALPQTLIGLLLALIYRAHSFRWHEGVLVCVAGTFERDGKTVTRIWGRPGAQTHGWLMIAASEGQLARVDLRVHEYVHVAQSFMFGPLYAITYGLAFLVLLPCYRFQWYPAYRHIPWEIWAYHEGDNHQPGDWGA